MAQAYVNYVKNLEKQKNASVQTGSENVNIVYRLPNKKMIRLYYSNIYKETVVSFNIPLPNVLLKIKKFGRTCENYCQQLIII
jgi:hypothetical protein